ncbi:MAG: type III pantothenate kinase [Phycisphaerae bacterium]|jgi:type III pantothenate kinase
MNILAVDIGNTNIKLGLFLDSSRVPSVSIAATDSKALAAKLAELWNMVPAAKRSTEGKKEGVIVLASVNGAATEAFTALCKDELGEKVLEIGIGKDIELPIKVVTDFPADTGIDRVLAAAAAWIVAQHAVVVADIGTAITVDAVDEDGQFVGGVIAPGPGLCAKALHENTAKLPLVEIEQPKLPIGANTQKAINNGIFYATAGLIEVSVRKFAEELGGWPQTIVTGAAGALFKDECEFVDNFVDDLVLSGIVLAYKKHIDSIPES